VGESHGGCKVRLKAVSDDGMALNRIRQRGPIRREIELAFLAQWRKLHIPLHSIKMEPYCLLIPAEGKEGGSEPMLSNQEFRDRNT